MSVLDDVCFTVHASEGSDRTLMEVMIFTSMIRFMISNLNFDKNVWNVVFKNKSCDELGNFLRLWCIYVVVVVVETQGSGWIRKFVFKILPRTFNSLWDTSLCGKGNLIKNTLKTFVLCLGAGCTEVGQRCTSDSSNAWMKSLDNQTCWQMAAALLSSSRNTDCERILHDVGLMTARQPVLVSGCVEKGQEKEPPPPSTDSIYS